jgi:GNAT superfamily N-acetyltransferase
MDRSEISAFLIASRQGYVAERVASGDPELTAARAADEQLAAAFPGGEPGHGHRVFCIEEEGISVGSLWLGPTSSNDPASRWVWDIEIDEKYRGRGYGRAAMSLAEREATAGGATTLGLNVFGANSIARRLYDSLGYEVMAIRMAKRLR